MRTATRYRTGGQRPLPGPLPAVDRDYPPYELNDTQV